MCYKCLHCIIYGGKSIKSKKQLIHENIFSTYYLVYSCTYVHLKQKHLRCKKVQSQSEAAVKQ